MMLLHVLVCVGIGAVVDGTRCWYYCCVGSKIPAEEQYFADCSLPPAFWCVCNICCLSLCSVYLPVFEVVRNGKPGQLHCCSLCFLSQLLCPLLTPLTVVDRDTAWTQLDILPGFGVGNSRSNSLMWAASRSPPLASFNATAARPAELAQVRPACAANSGCDALGMVGMCCPNSEGVFLGCCPVK